MLHTTETTVQTVAGVALFEQTVMTQGRHPSRYEHFVQVPAASGAFDVDGLTGAGWINIGTAIPDTDHPEVGPGYDQIRVTLASGAVGVSIVLRTFPRNG